MKRLSFLSLFSGCGGLDTGFLEKGYRCEGAFDIDNDAVETYNTNFGSHAYTLDLSETVTKEFRSFRNIDLVLSGAPCQGFSTVGKRDINDPRNHLLTKGAEIAISIGAKLFVCENVMGSVQGKHVEHWKRVASKFARAGYSTSFSVVNTLHLNLPQSRQRVIFIASKKQSARSVSTERQERIPTLRDLAPQLMKVRQPKETLHSALAAKVAPQVKPGQKVSDVRKGPNVIHTWDLEGIFPHATVTERVVLDTLIKLRRSNRLRDFGDSDPVSAEKLSQYLEFDPRVELSSLLRKKYITKVSGSFNIRNGFNGLYRRLSFDSPSNTVDTRFGNPRLYLHPVFNRGFSVSEAAAIQGFDPHFSFAGSTISKFRMIGNSVSPVASRYLADQLG